MPPVAEEISIADSNLEPETWVDQYGDYLYRFALACNKKNVNRYGNSRLIMGRSPS